jgi:hypothetical protein
MSIPADLSRLSDIRLAALDRRCERALKHEIDRMARTDVRFSRVLREALRVEDEVLRRSSPSGGSGSEGSSTPSG